MLRGYGSASERKQCLPGYEFGLSDEHSQGSRKRSPWVTIVVAIVCVSAVAKSIRGLQTPTSALVDSSAHAVDAAPSPSLTSVEPMSSEPALHAAAMTTSSSPAAVEKEASALPGGEWGHYHHGKDLDDDDPYLTSVKECTNGNCGFATLGYPREVSSEHGYLDFTLEVQPARFESVLSMNTRSFSDDGKPGPTLRVKKGDNVTIRLANRLDFPTQADITFTGYEYEMAMALGQCEPYQSPNVTSMHFHGMLIDPNKKGDSPYRICSPLETITYEFHIPKDHPSGTFWYHPHHAPSHSVQAAGLMGGLIIVEDTDYATNSDDSAMNEAVATTTELLAKIDDDAMLMQWLAIENSFKNMDFLSMCTHSSMAVNSVVWEDVQGYDWVFINGYYKPIKNMTKGVFQRWRMVNGMSHRYVGANVPDACDAYIIAVDGVYLHEPRHVEYIAISLGARADVLVRCSEDAVWSSTSPPWLDSSTATEYFGDDPGFFEHHFMNTTVSEVDTEDATQVAKKEASDEIWTRMQEGSLTLDSGFFVTQTKAAENTSGVDYHVKLSEFSNAITEWYTLNDRTYDGRVHHRVRLDQPQFWNITHDPVTTSGKRKNHNWHLHGYHFKILSMTDESGTVFKESPMLDWISGDWRDTISIPVRGTAQIAWYPIMYTGIIMHHCHIYNHETAGMKELLSVVDCRNQTAHDMNKHMCHEEGIWPFMSGDSTHDCKQTVQYICMDANMDMSDGGSHARRLHA